MTIPSTPSVHSFLGYDIPSLIAERAKTRRSHPFLIWHPFESERRFWTYGQFHHDVERVAAGLINQGVKPGDRVLIHLDNCPELLLSWYACARINAIAVTTNTRSTPDEISYFSEHSSVCGAITQPAFRHSIASNAKSIKWLTITDHDSGTPAKANKTPNLKDSFNNLLGDPQIVPKLYPNPMAPIGVQYTSGTTSRPKGVLWTHANALWGARVNAAHENLQPQDIHLCYLPLFHTNAQAYSILATLWAGASCVLLPRWTTSRFWQLSLQYKCTWTSMVWFCLNALAETDAPTQHYYRLWGNAMGAPPQDKLYGVKTIGWWGMTETISHGIVGNVHLENRPMAIGKPALEYGISIQREDGSSIESGETGHLKVSGVPGISLFKEYLNDHSATKASYDDAGWFLTGDMVTLHDDGFISFSGRDKDMLKIGGENVAAAEIERVLLELPEVTEAAVVGKKHPMLDEEAVAFILIQGGPNAADPNLSERAMANCKTKLADFKVPAEIRILESFPRSTLEKVAKTKLRELLEFERKIKS